MVLTSGGASRQKKIGEDESCVQVFEKRVELAARRRMSLRGLDVTLTLNAWSTTNQSDLVHAKVVSSPSTSVPGVMWMYRKEGVDVGGRSLYLVN
jgi:hypothetical protein